MGAELKEAFDGAIATENDQKTGQLPAEESTPTQEKADDTQQLTQLDQDEEFQKSVPKEFNRHPAWRKLYWEKKENARKTEELNTRLAELEEQASAQPAELGDDELEQLAKEKGYTLTKAQQQAQLDELSNMLNGVESVKDRTWLNNYANAIKKSVMDEIKKTFEPPLKEFSNVSLEYKIDRDEKLARRMIEDANKAHGSKIDYDKDVDPELIKMIKSGKYNVQGLGLIGLVKEYLAQNGIKLGKQIAEESMRKLNEEKKRASSETGSTNTKTTASANKSFREIFNDAMNEEGMQ